MRTERAMRLCHRPVEVIYLPPKRSLLTDEAPKHRHCVNFSVLVGSIVARYTRFVGVTFCYGACEVVQESSAAEIE